MRWSGQELGTETTSALPGLAKLNNLVRSVQTPEFAGVTFHEVLAKSALNKVPGQSEMPFGWTINPYRGCSHACVYCLGPETLILMADGRQQPLWLVKPGDEIVGTEVIEGTRRYAKTTVRASWNTRKVAYRIRLADGTELVASGDHRFLTERGWKFVTGAMQGAGQRPYLTTGNRLVGFGLAGLTEKRPSKTWSEDSRRGYLTGMFHLALADPEALARSRACLERESVSTFTRVFSTGGRTRKPLVAIHSGKATHFDHISELIAWRTSPSMDWSAGFLAGVFDAEGSDSCGVLRISSGDRDIVQHIGQALSALGVAHIQEPPRPNGVSSVRLTGGTAMRARFLQLTEPAVTREPSVLGQATRSSARLEVESIEPIGMTDLIDITTGTGDFVANGVISHNCFARPTHEYLELDAGRDFDTQVIVKVNVAEVVAKELAKPSWGKHPVALGTNTDPYQRAEGKYRLMPGIIGALADSGTPFSILTKGTLLRRDLPLLAEAAQRVPVDLAMSIAIFDDELQHSIEPGTPTAAARLATVTAARDHGFDVSVFMMPILPYLTDSVAHLDDALTRIAQAGATSVLYSALHLKAGVKPWYLQWLAREHPELVERYEDLYRTGMHAPKEYRRWLAARIRPLIRAHGLERGREDPATGGVRSSAIGMMRNDEGERVSIRTGVRFDDLAKSGAPMTGLQVQPTLF